MSRQALLRGVATAKDVVDKPSFWPQQRGLDRLVPAVRALETRVQNPGDQDVADSCSAVSSLPAVLLGLEISDWSGRIRIHVLLHSMHVRGGRRWRRVFREHRQQENSSTSALCFYLIL